MNRKILFAAYVVVLICAIYFASLYIANTVVCPSRLVQASSGLAAAPPQESSFSLPAVSSFAILIILCICAAYLPIGFVRDFFENDSKK